jgi:uncharacterized protein YdiU (UPF0061 family)
LAGTGEEVVRDMFYDGHPRPEPGAVICRVSPSFVRFGNFQIHTANNELDALKRLADYVIAHHFPGMSFAQWFHEVCRRTALLLADWMRLGFVHGVMNTDNMSILGLTIDYGPYGWLEGYDPMWTPNTTDLPGRRYCYGNQPHIALWNLARLAEALLPLAEREALEEGLKLYGETFQTAWRRALAQKLGLVELDEELAGSLFELLASAETDFTLFFRYLAAVPLEESLDDAALIAPLRRSFYAEREAAPLAAWLRRYIARVKQEGVALHTRVQRMNSVNPKYVFRNYLAQLAIDALEQGDASVLERLIRVLARPYDEQPEHDDLAERRPEWARERPGCSALSCSS